MDQDTENKPEIDTESLYQLLGSFTSLCQISPSRQPHSKLRKLFDERQLNSIQIREETLRSLGRLRRLAKSCRIQKHDSYMISTAWKVSRQEVTRTVVGISWACSLKEEPTSREDLRSANQSWSLCQWLSKRFMKEDQLISKSKGIDSF